MGKKCKIIISLCLLFVTILMAGFISKPLLHASSISVNDFEDENLYYYLLNLNDGNPLTPDSFNSGEFTVFNLNYDHVNNIGEDDETDVKFVSLKGLERFKFDYITSFSAKGHDLETIELNDLKTMIVLENLDLTNNKLTNVNLTKLPNLTNVNLSNNRLTSLQDIVILDNNVNVNLNANLITNMENLSTNNYSFGLQGATNGYVVYEKSFITFTPFENVDYIEVYKNNEFLVTLPNFHIQSLGLIYGRYRVEFYSNDAQAVTPSAVEFNIKVKAPTINFMQNDKVVEQTYNVYNQTTVKFEGEGQVYYVLEGKTYNSNTLKIDDYGKYKITYYQVIEGVKSDEKYLVVNSFINSYVGWIYIIVGIILFVIVISLILKHINRPINGKMQKRENF